MVGKLPRRNVKFHKINPPPTLTPQERVRRRYPAAKYAINEEGWHVIYANNGTGNEIAASDISEQDAWAHAAQRSR